MIYTPTSIFKKVKNRIRKYKFKRYLLNIQKSKYEEIINLRNEYIPLIDNKLNSECVVFSKDRAMQLHALLATFFEKVEHYCPINVIYTCSTEEHTKSYQQLMILFKDKPVNFIYEKNFKEQLINLLEKMDSTKVFFLCDDQYVKESFDLNSITKFNPLSIMFSLNRGLDSTKNVGVQYDLPKFIDNIIDDSDKKVWIWKDNAKSPDWAYPLSVGGVFFSTREMKILLEMIDFTGPNTLEGKLQDFSDIFVGRYGVCSKQAIIGSTPCNIVSTESNCPDTGTHGVNELLEKWKSGYRIKYEDFYGKKWDDLLNTKFQFIKRD